MNTILKIFDNIGFKFGVKNHKFYQQEKIKSFNLLDRSHVGYHIPYIARVSDGGLWEVGVGLVEFDENGDVVVSRTSIASSSNHNNSVNFPSSGKCEFYLFANQSNFDTAFSNTIIVDKSITAYNQKSTYLVDTTNQHVDLVLPKEPLDNLEIDVKLIEGSNNVTVRENNGHVILVLSNYKDYVRLIYKDKWYVVNTAQLEEKLSSLASGDDNIFSAMSVPNGDPYSFQFNDGANNFDGAGFFIGSGNGDILFGADNVDQASTIIPTTGTGDVIFNNQHLSSDFIVHGSGTKNLFFTYDGKLGLNIPSGSRPTTIFHVVNTLCQEGFRLENRSVCHPANVTLYHKPSPALSSNDQISQINLSAKNSTGNKKDFVKIEAYAINNSYGSELGHLDLVFASGFSDVNALSADINNIVVGYSGLNYLNFERDTSTTLGSENNDITIDDGGITLDTSNTTINSSSSFVVNSSTSNIASNNVTLGSGTSTITIQGIANITELQSPNITIPSISPSSLLAVDDNNDVIASSGVILNEHKTLSFTNIPSGYFITTLDNGTLSGVYTLEDYFRTDSDILWNKYPKRAASVCLRQVTPNESISLAEFSVGDQIALENEAGETSYRFILEIYSDNNVIESILLDQNLTASTTSGYKIYSITKGGYLSISRDVADGSIGDNSDIILSIRPGVSTEFNTERKNIDFIVYGTEEIPAFSVKAFSDQVVFESGYYNVFATRDCNPAIFPMVINASGQGLSNLYSSANYGYDIDNPDDRLHTFSGIVSDVGSNGISSYYGTYDQNGNVAEWVEKELLEMRDHQEIVAGGSVFTSNSGTISPTGLRSIEFIDRSGCYDHVGFRIASAYNMVDESFISDNLSFDFVTVTDSDNIADTSDLYLKDGDSYSLVSVDGLGSVENFYRIGKYEVTNAQYVEFLEAVARENDRDLYDSRMYSEAIGGIEQIALMDSDVDYSYAVKTHMADKPVNFVSFISAIRFTNWLHNGAPTGVADADVDVTIDTGAYDVIPNDNAEGSYIVAKKRYRKYWIPSLNQWHKAAYFEPTASTIGSGISSSMFRRPDPYEVVKYTDGALYASVSVSGWLYTDRLIVGDNPQASSPLPRRELIPGTESCSSNVDCFFCEVCSENGFCEQSSDICCESSCCFDWDQVNGVCNNCLNCSDDGGGIGNNIPCPPFC